VQNQKLHILLVTGNDDTYRKILLESHGYSVTPAQPNEVLSVLHSAQFHLVLVATHEGLSDSAAFCEQIKSSHPNLRVGVVAQHGERTPLESCADIVIHAQYSPAGFLGAINTVLNKGDKGD
jgi:CheY-like chemotaxis protein